MFALIAHGSAMAISVWMGRWDLLLAGILFAAPSAYLFHDLSPHGKGRVILLMKKIV